MPNWCRREFMTIAAAAVAFGATMLPGRGESAPLLASRSGLPWSSGASTSGPDDFVALRGRKLDTLTYFLGRGSWSIIRNAADQLVAQLDPKQGNRRETIVVTYPLFPNNDSPQIGGPAIWQKAAVGAYDAHHAAAALGFRRYPQRFIFRIGHEWNCCYPWKMKQPELAPYYKAYFRRVVDIFRAQHPTCLIDWCSIKRNQILTGIDYFYPGNDWVDIIGHDKYDMHPPLRNKTEWNRESMKIYKDSPLGIGAWLAYAKSKGKRLGVSEWAVTDGPDYPAGGGDDAYFVARMLQFFKDNAADIAYESYFNKNALQLGWYHKLSLEDNPKARAAYQAFFRSQP